MHSIFTRLEKVRIVITNDVFQFCVGNISGHFTEMIETFISFGTARRLAGWKHCIEFHCNQCRIDHGIFTGTRVDIESFDLNDGFTCIEILILDLSLRTAIHRVGEFCIEVFYIEMVDTGSSLFIRSKCNRDFSVRDLFFLNPL